MLSVITRTSGRQVALRARTLHTTAPVRSDAHGHYHHFPFAFPTEKNKAIFGLKVFLFLGTGASIPVVASWWQLKKASGET